MTKLTMVGFGRVVACAAGVLGAVAVAPGAGLPWVVPAQVPQFGDDFGEALALTGDTLFVGADSYFDGSATTGAVFVYRWLGLNWAQLGALAPSDLSDGDRFGAAIAADGATVIVGAPLDDGPGGSNQGSATIFVHDGAGWVEQAKLVADDGGPADLFGVSVAIHGDTAIVGAVVASAGPSATTQGAAYVFVRTGTTWAQQAKLVNNNGLDEEDFGVAVAVRGDTAIVGAPGDTFQPGSAYVFTREGAIWSMRATLQPAFGPVGNRFGSAIALADGAAIIGAPTADVLAAFQCGAAYEFLGADDTWTETNTISALDGWTGDRFGASLAFEGNLAIVGAPGRDESSDSNVGAAYRFVRDGGVWTQTTKVWHWADGSDEFGISVALDGSLAVAGAPGFIDSPLGNGAVFAYQRIDERWVSPPQSVTGNGSLANDNFGHSVDISGDTAIAGSPFFDPTIPKTNAGAASIFVRSGAEWRWTHTLLPIDGAQADFAGWSVAISGDTAVVGAYLDDDAGNASGSAYVFVRNGASWSQQAKLVAPDAAAGDWFGRAVAISGETVIVGAPLDDNGLGSNAGAAYVYTRLNGVWSFSATLLPNNMVGAGQFGSSVAIDGATAIVGAPYDGGLAAAAGAAFTFVRGGGVWTQDAKLTALDGALADNFGTSVSISQGTAVVGAPYHDHQGEDAGSAYTYERRQGGWALVEELLPPVFAPGDNFGAAVDIEFATAVVGAPFRNGGGGAAWVFPRGAGPGTPRRIFPAGSAPSDSFGTSVAISGDTVICGSPLAGGARGFAHIRSGAFGVNRGTTAWNRIADTHWTALDAAIANAADGDILSAAHAGFQALGPIDSAGRAIDIESAGEIRTIYTAATTLAHNATLTAPLAADAEFFAPLIVPAGASATLNAAAVRLGPLSALTLHDGAALHINGDFDVAIDRPALFDTADGELVLIGTGAIGVEAMAADLGPNCASDRPFEIGALRLQSPVVAIIVDHHANGSSGADALVVSSLVIEPNAVLITNGRRVYYDTLDNQGVVDDPANLIPNCGPSPDLNGDGQVNGADLGLLLGAWGTPAADLNGDGTTDGADLGLLLGAWGA